MSEQVLCVDDSNPRNPGPMVVRGQIYTARNWHRDCNGEAGVLLAEISTGLFRRDGYEVGYLAYRFVPIKDENLEIFREMDRKIFGRVNA